MRYPLERKNLHSYAKIPTLHISHDHICSQQKILLRFPRKSKRMIPSSWTARAVIAMRCNIRNLRSRWWDEASHTTVLRLVRSLGNTLVQQGALFAFAHRSLLLFTFCQGSSQIGLEGNWEFICLNFFFSLSNLSLEFLLSFIYGKGAILDLYFSYES